MAGIENLLEIRSLSKHGLSQVTLVFADNTDPYRARQLATERLQSLPDQLPPGLTITLPDLQKPTQRLTRLW
jgi:cobalt-zinc-cadmium resistance protein CzcA